MDYVVNLKSGDDRSEEQGYEGMTRLLALKSVPDGVFCYNDEVAIGALRAILEAGMRIPADIAVIGVDNIRFADLLRVPLSSVDQNNYQIGERAAQLALKLIELKTAPPRQITLPIGLIAGESTAVTATSRRPGVSPINRHGQANKTKFHIANHISKWLHGVQIVLEYPLIRSTVP